MDPLKVITFRLRSERDLKNDIKLRQKLLKDRKTRQDWYIEQVETAVKK